jgi:hypothetical protein
MEPLPVIVREGSMLRGTAIAISAAGIGILILLACWGASFFWRTDNGTKEKLDALIKFTEAINTGLKQGKKEIITKIDTRTDEVLAKIDSAVASLRLRIDDYNSSSTSSISRQLDVIQSQIYDLKSKSPIIVPPQSKGGEDPKIIQTEVTVFKSIEHEGGHVHTGWTFPNGASADSPPKLQYCYWTTQPRPDTTAQIDVWIAVNGKQLTNIPSEVPNLSGALDKCVRWDGGTTQHVESPKQKPNRGFQPLGDRWGRPL